MKKTFILGLFASALFFSCSSDDEETPLVADFTATVSGESPNAEIIIVNNSTGASAYEWSFSEGADISSSEEQVPTVKVDKAGDLTISLIAINGSNEEKTTKTVSVSGNTAITTFNDVEFGLNAGDATYGRLFSLETGEIYKDSEISSDNGSKINLAFGSMANTMYFFESPTDEDYNVPGAIATKVTNYEETPSITVEEFDAMTNDGKLSGLTIEETNDSFGNGSIPNTVLFETSTGRKGVIKTKAVNSDRLLVDIKVQKY
ncbi:hypothetical protein GCM10009122_13560 [Fulvivirga kasyanovii]|uniref:PKD domain-containing protein n=1 Tax=Fulvivirga kasyanovii TaxID=396812 RepID=A0ABW9RP14_9BACT|nr:PKD domain-containing protein [Fulvivirga kasyanovii]MTI25874.1 hypothetical protein [Fulvivirga kasyanovii]